MTYTPPRPTAIQAAVDGSSADPKDPPAETAVRLLASIGTSDQPQVLAVETSQSGKTATIEREGGIRHRLDMTALLAGDRIERNGYWYELYTPGRYRDRLDRTPRTADLPEATHQPA